MQFTYIILIFLSIFIFLSNCTKKKNNPYAIPVTISAPADNAINPQRIELGKNLYFDPRLSGSNWISCASCHNPSLGWSDGLPTGIGHGFGKLGRNSPTIVNTALNFLQFWDGRSPSLEDQAAGPIASPGEMNQDFNELIKELEAISGYREMFEKAYPGQGISKETITKAIATFERTIISKDSPFDRWMEGDESQVSESAKKGFALFVGKAKCAVCHSGNNFSDNGFHNIGIKSLDGKQDEGRFALVPVKVMKGAFKTPTLREIALSGPYMHNGIYKTLDEVVEHYNRNGDVRDNLSPNMQGPLNLTDSEKKDLVEFLKTLTGRPIQITLPILPQ